MFFKEKLRIKHVIKKSKFKESNILMLDNKKQKNSWMEIEVEY